MDDDASKVAEVGVVGVGDDVGDGLLELDLLRASVAPRKARTRSS